MTTIVIVDKICEQDTTFNESFLNSCLSDDEHAATAINLTDLSSNVVYKSLQGFWNQINYIDGFDIYTTIEEDFNSFLSRWLSELLNLKPKIPLVEYSRISEQNFSTEFFQEFKKLHLIYYVVAKFRPKQLVYIGDKELRSCVREICNKFSIHCRIYPDLNTVQTLRQIVRPIWRTTLLFIFNVVVELSALTTIKLLRFKSSCAGSVKKRVGIYAHYPANWFSNPTQSYYRYTGSLYENLNYAGEAYYLVSVLRNNSDALNGPANSIRACFDLKSNPSTAFAVLESYGSFNGIFLSYFNIPLILRWFKGWRYADESRCLAYLEISLKPILRQLRFSIFREIPKNVYTERTSANAKSVTNPDYLYLPLYELLEGRAVCAGHTSDSTTTIGVQHGIMYNLQIQRAIGSLTELSSHGFVQYIPDIVATEGETAKSYYRNFQLLYPRINVVGSPRLDLSKNGIGVSNGYLRDREQAILIFEDIYSSMRLKNIAKHLSNFYPIIFKPHPGRSNFSKHLNSLSLLADNHDITVDTRSLREILIRISPIVGICCLSGISIDLAAMGVPVIHVTSNEYPMLSPSGVFKSYAPVLKTLSAVTDEVRKLDGSIEYRTKRIQSGLLELKNMIHTYGDDAAINLASFSKKRL